MVDAIGSKAVTPYDRLVTPVIATPAAAAAAAPAAAKLTATVDAPRDTVASQRDPTAVTSNFGAPSPAEQARVEEVRRAVRNGTYPINPETIADRMLALKLYWSPKS